MAALAPAQFTRSMEGYVSELSLRFIALHLLSCLGHYRPATWMHALPRAGSADHFADDTMLALLEKLMAINESTMPNLVSDVLSPDLTKY